MLYSRTPRLRKAIDRNDWVQECCLAVLRLQSRWERKLVLRTMRNAVRRVYSEYKARIESERPIGVRVEDVDKHGR